MVTPVVAPASDALPAATGGPLESECIVPLAVRDTLVVNASATDAGNATETFMFDFEEASFDQVWSGAYDYSIEGAVSTWNTACPEPDSYGQGLSVDGNMLTLSIDMTETTGCGIVLWSYERQ